jgi:hypothetical protein
MGRLWILLLVAACHSNNGHPADGAIVIDGKNFDDAAAVAPVFRNPVMGSDSDVATQALQILGAPVSGAQVSSCNTCHGVTREHLRYWRALGDTAMGACLTNLQVNSSAEALTMVDCLRTMPMVGTSDFMPQKLGIYASAARLPWFDYVFTLAYGTDAPAQKASFIMLAAMPHGDQVAPLTQDQFDVVAEWIARGEPMLDDLMPQDGAPTTCDAAISSDVATHTAALATTGWRAVNKDNGMSMFDCGAATDPKLCMTHEALASTTAYGAAWDMPGYGHARILEDVTYQSSYWTRSSPDGRFVAHGNGTTGAATIIDLQRGVFVAVSASYDPGFFPDNSGFVFQGFSNNTCPLSVLTSNPASVAMTEPGCAGVTDVHLYQHVAKGLGGGDYFALDSDFVSDDGGHYPTFNDPQTFFDNLSTTRFTPMINTGTGYMSTERITTSTPYEGDSVLSPSATLELTRVAGPSSTQLGYVLHKVTSTMGANHQYTVDTPEIARYCISGSKVAFSYDERWIVFHHYISGSDADAQELGFANAADPGFAGYLNKGTANIYLMDIATGVPHRITNMKPGQYALMPHFRSDGWIYADVREAGVGHEYFIASDAALVNE